MFHKCFRHFIKEHCRQRRALRWMSTKYNSSAGSEKTSFFEGKYLLLVCPATCFCLCVWQLQRKKWKEDLIEKLKRRKKMEPVPLPDDLSQLKDLHLYPVKVKGHYEYENEVYLGPKGDAPEGASSFQVAADQHVPGFHVITPFKLTDRDLTIMVNRGWLEGTRFKHKEARERARVYGEQEIVGIVRKDQNTSASFWMLFSNFDKPSKQNNCDVYLVRKLDVLAKRCGTAPVYLDLKTERKSLDEPRPAAVGTGLRNTHLEYAITWFGLGMFTLWMWYAKYKSPKATGILGYVTQQEAKRKAGQLK